MEKITKYQKTKRLESAIIEEKLDGSNFCWTKQNGELSFYSRNCKLDINECEKFYTKFVNFIIEKDKMKPFEEGYEYFAEAIGQAQIKYKVENIEDKLYVFDILNTHNGKYVKREVMEQMTSNHEIKPVPLTTIDEQYSKIDPNVKREGIILRYEDIERIDGQVVKIKLVERKVSGGKYHERNVCLMTTNPRSPRVIKTENNIDLNDYEVPILTPQEIEKELKEFDKIIQNDKLIMNSLKRLGKK